MSLLAAGVQKRLIFKKEATFGTPDGTSGGEYLRRVESSLALSKDNYESAEIRVDLQMADMRHGVKRVGGNLRGELSLASYEGFIQSAFRRDFTAGPTAITAGVATEISFTAAAGSVLAYLVEDDGTDWAATNGFRVGDVWTISGANTAANDINIMVVSFEDSGGTNDKMNVIEVSGAIVTDAADSGVTLTFKGKKTFMPLTGHTSDSYSIEAHHSDTDDSRRFDGCHIAGFALSVPPTGLATIDFPVVGQDMAVLEAGSAPHFTAPTAANTNSILAAVNGALVIADKKVATLTGLEINVDVPWDADPVVGSDVLTCFFPGIMRVSGQFTAYFADEDLLNDFLNETERSLHVVMTAPGTTPPEFFSIFIPRLKIGGAPESDGVGGLIQTMPFTALLKQGNADYESTTVVVQDSLLV
jgi:hypothetical protein